MNHYVMLTEVRSAEAKRIRRERKDKDYSPRRGKVLIPRKDQLVQALQTGLTRDHYVLVSRRSTHTQSKFINRISRSITTMGTSQKSTKTNSLTSTFSSADFPANLLASPENAEALMTPEERYSLTSRGYSKLKNRNNAYSKMLKDYCLMTVESLSKPSSPRLMNWGMTSGGKCLTAKILVSRRTGNEYSLSDILEAQPDPKYFLSEKMIAFLVTDRGKFPPQLLPDTTNRDSQTLISLLRMQQALPHRFGSEN